MVKSKIAIIPARGGSKRIKNKNIIDFNGKPMIAWTIDAAKESGLFDRILVSTDDTQIADISRKSGAEVPFLREEHADDHSTVSEATHSAFIQATQHWNEDYDIVVQLMANCPLRSSEDIILSVSKFENNERSAQISCFEYGWINPWWATTIDSKGKPSKLFPETMNKRSQDLPKLFCPTGAIWISKADDLLKYKSFYSPNHTFEPISMKSAVDIDDYEDLAFAKVLSKMQAYTN